jgi:hypothetical protein
MLIARLAYDIGDSPALAYRFQRFEEVASTAETGTGSPA